MSILDDIGGLLSGGGNSSLPAPYYVDPRIAMLSRIAGAAGQSAMPSRLPVPNGAVLGNIGGAVAPGMAEGQQIQSGNYAQYGQQLKNTFLQNWLRSKGLLDGAAQPQAAPAGGEPSAAPNPGIGVPPGYAGATPVQAAVGAPSTAIPAAAPMPAP